MRWRDVIVGFFSALLVTIIGGALVYYITREAPREEPAEKLLYFVEQTATFSAEKTKFALFGLRVGNTGSRPAQNVDVGIVVEAGNRIVDKSISLSSGPAGKFSITKEQAQELVFRLPCLAPNETASIALMLAKEPEKQPTIGVKSEGSVGIEGILAKQAEPDKKKQMEKLLSVMLPILGALQIALVFYLRKKLRRYDQNVNNTAFLYLHRGLNKEARSLIEHEVGKRGADSHLLSNYAVCMALEGDFDGAQTRLSAAEFLATSKHQRAVLLFNQGLVSFLKGEASQGSEQIEQALLLSKREIPKYCTYSTVVKDLAEKHPQLQKKLDELLTESRKHRTIASS